MGEFKVHHVRFFEYQPLAIHCIAYEKLSQRLALSRSDGTVEIWSKPDNWYQEKVISVCDKRSVEGLAWLGTRLFSVGLHGYLEEYDLASLQIKRQAPSSSGAIWCVTANPADDQLAVGTEDGCVVLFDASCDDLQYLKSFDRLEGRIICLAWHIREALIITGGPDNIRIWSVQSGHALQRIVLGGKETMVWCLAVTSDLTIISGDSRGRIAFWNGKQGTRITQFQSHKADVLTLCVDEEGTNVFCSGVDPAVAQYSFMTPSENSGWRSWVRTSTHTHHTHDVRASVVVDNLVITGGVDTALVCSNIAGGSKKKYFKLQAIPSQTLVSVAKDSGLLLLRFPTYLELWRLGHTNASSNVNGEILPLRSAQVKLAVLKARKGESIACSTISHDGTLIAFSDQEKLRLYRLKFTDLQSLSPLIEMSGVRLPSSDNCVCAHRLAITPNNQMLLAATSAGSLQLWDIDEDSATLHTTILPGEKRRDSFTNLVTTDKFASTSDTGGHVYLYSLKDGQVMCQLPALSFQATALSISPTGCTLLVVYSDHTVYEFATDKKEYSSWCRKSSSHFPNQWLRQRGCLRGIKYQPGNLNKIFTHSEHNLLVIDKKQAMPENNYPLFPNSTKSEKNKSADNHRPLISCCKYKFIMYTEFLDADSLVIVERTVRAISEKLEEPLRQKKFGL